MTRIYALYALFFSVSVGVSYTAFMYAPAAEGLGESSRILYLHVPAAWMSVLSFCSSGFFAVWFLLSRKMKHGLLMHAGAELGMLCIIAATVSGAVWAHEAWGVFWNWDIRQTTVALVLLIYAGYFAIPSRSSSSDIPRAGYLAVSAVLVPLFVFVFPRMYPTLHPSPVITQSGEIHLDMAMRFAFVLSLFLYSILFIVLYRLCYRLLLLSHSIREEK
ncbi:MAG: cytochrome c biogenesis protein CcsA [Spirochaetota bacterium]